MSDSTQIVKIWQKKIDKNRKRIYELNDITTQISNSFVIFEDSINYLTRAVSLFSNMCIGEIDYSDEFSKIKNTLNRDYNLLKKIKSKMSSEMNDLIEMNSTLQSRINLETNTQVKFSAKYSNMNETK